MTPNVVANAISLTGNHLVTIPGPEFPNRHYVVDTNN